MSTNRLLFWELYAAQGHTVRIVDARNPIYENQSYKFDVYCLDCDFQAYAQSEAEARFDVRYHGLKQHPTDQQIDWDKLLLTT